MEPIELAYILISIIAVIILLKIVGKIIDCIESYDNHV
jgi:hypothetical protein